MDAPFDPRQIGEHARLAAEAVKGAQTPLDHALKLEVPDHFDQAWIDDVVLQAHMRAPLWSDYALVKHRPDIWGMAYHTAQHVEDRMVLPADDSFVVATDDEVEILVTATPVAGEDGIFFQLGCHCFTMSFEAYFYPSSFRNLASAYGLLAYPDSALIDELDLRQSGAGAKAYIADERRTRPIFIMRRQARLPTAVRKYLHAARVSLSGFGPVVCSDELFNEYRDHLTDRKGGVIAVAPQGEVFALERSPLIVPTSMSEVLARCDIEPPASVVSSQTPMRGSAQALWFPAVYQAPSLALLQKGGELFKQVWAQFLERFAPPSHSDDGAAEKALEPEIEIIIEAPSLEAERIKPLKLDGDGYPTDASDIARWADGRLSDQLVIAPRARRALTKSDHPDPRRIAEALELLAGPKWRGHMGEAGTVASFEAGLLKLKMRDGFSNAERLKGQTGADYVLEHGGRKLLLERHLRSNSSGFNDPRMVRIYYVFDRLLQKIVVGWLPSHLRTSQS